MKRPYRQVILCLAILAGLAAPATADHPLDGTWSFDVTLADGQGGKATITLEEGEEGTLSGSYSGALGEQEITGKVEGSRVEISFDSQAGKVRFEGDVQEDGTISGSCVYGQLGEGSFTARKKE